VILHQFRCDDGVCGDARHQLRSHCPSPKRPAAAFNFCSRRTHTSSSAQTDDVMNEIWSINGYSYGLNIQFAFLKIQYAEHLLNQPSCMLYIDYFHTFSEMTETAAILALFESLI
jgi:hypothetical protein